mgnify:CR=1 FL=1
MVKYSVDLLSMVVRVHDEHYCSSKDWMMVQLFVVDRTHDFSVHFEGEVELPLMVVDDIVVVVC